MQTSSEMQDLIGALRSQYPGRVSTTPPDRSAYARDLWPRGLLGLASGRTAPFPPDAVVWPESAEEVSAIVAAAAKRKIPIVPFGAGSGVCGGTVPIHGGFVVDLKRMRRLRALDEKAGLATFDAGIVGEHLEHELNRRGYTMGHFPSSIMCSTLGGWLAARSAGQFSTKYGKIEDMVQRVTFVDGKGAVHALDYAHDANAIQLVVGSEGTLGIITQATCVIHPLAEARAFRGWSLPNVRAGCEAIRRILQLGLRPCAVRLYNELDSFIHRRDKEATPADEEGFDLEQIFRLLWPRELVHQAKRKLFQTVLAQPLWINQLSQAFFQRAGTGCLLVVGFEGAASLVRAESDCAARELVAAGGVDLGEGPGEHWLKHRYSVSFRQSKAFDSGLFVDTMEVATTWDRLMALYDAVRNAIAPYAFIMAHFSHAYPEGCSIYFTFAAPREDRQVSEARYDRIWQAGLEAVHRVGGTISHHHGIGLSKAPYMPLEHGEAMRLYRALKHVLDPNNIMNPGKMGL